MQVLDCEKDREREIEGAISDRKIEQKVLQRCMEAGR